MDRESEENKPSIIWRADTVIFDHELPRWATRVWLRQRTGSSWERAGFANVRPIESFPNSIKQHENAGRKVPATAEAYLVPPAHQKEVSRIYVRGHYGKYYGIPKHELGEVTCYIKPHYFLGGFCAHASLQMCSIPMVDYGWRVPSAYEISYEAHRLVSETDCNRNDSHYCIRGLSIEELKKLIRNDKLVNGNCQKFVIELGDDRYDKRVTNWVTHLLHQVVKLGFPVLLRVDAAKLYDDKYREDLLEQSGKSRLPHTVVIIGATFGCNNDIERCKPSGYIVHDPLYGPFYEIKASDLLEASAFPRGKGPDSQQWPFKISLLVNLPNQVRLPLMSVVEYAVGLAASFDAAFFRKTLKRPFFSLVHRDAITGRYFGDRRKAVVKVRNLVGDHLDKLPEWLWAVEYYANNRDIERNEAQCLYLFDATGVNGHRLSGINHLAALLYKGQLLFDSKIYQSDPIALPVRLRVGDSIFV